MNLLNPNQNFWSGKRILVTGHTGFKGGWLTSWLLALGSDVCGFSLPPPTAPSFFNEVGLANRLRSELGDIRELEQLLSVMVSHRPEIIFHLAAQPLVRRSYADPIETYSTNVMGTINVFEGARRAGSVRAIVNVTSDKCYENREWMWGYRETDPMGGHDPYSNSKGCSELITGAYRQSFFRDEGIAIASARAGNVIGGGDWSEDRLVPDALRAFEQLKSVVLRNPMSVRPWQHVLEPLSGYLALAERLYEGDYTFADGWNFGPSDEGAKSVSWIVDRLAQAWGLQSITPWIADTQHQPHEANMLRLDITKARSLLAWQPRWDLDTALNKIVGWHRAWQAGANMAEWSLNEIREYQHTVP